MSSTEKIRERMGLELARMQAKNPQFSLRGFARRLGISPSLTSEILSGKKKVTSRVALKIVSGLGIHGDEAIKLISSIEKSKGSKSTILKKHQVMPIDMDRYHLISDWYYFAVHSLVETESFKNNPTWIASTLGITTKQARTALNRLFNLGLIQTDSRGKVTTTGKTIATTSDLSHLALRRSHHQSLDLARESLDQDPVDTRDFSSMTLAIDPARMDEAKTLIRRFRRNFCARMESGQKKKVYRIFIQFFNLERGSL